MEDKKIPKIITEAEYKKLFGLKKIKKHDIRKNALKKAWEIRNYEIDKFWHRSAFFWGFIALIFTGYFTVITGKNSLTAKELYLDFYLILLGVIFSYAWLLVIRGSKQWQKNWESHIDYLEDEITGPLYKTIYYTGKKFYSVSRISEILAWVVIAIWGVLLFQYFYTKCNIIKDIFEYISNNSQVFIFLILPLLGAIFCIIWLKTKGQTSGGEFNKNLEKGEHGKFTVRDKGTA